MDQTCSLMAVLQSSRTMLFTPEHPTLMRPFGWTGYQGSHAAAHLCAVLLLTWVLLLCCMTSQQQALL